MCHHCDYCDIRARHMAAEVHGLKTENDNLFIKGLRIALADTICKYLEIADQENMDVSQVTIALIQIGAIMAANLSGSVDENIKWALQNFTLALGVHTGAEVHFEMGEEEMPRLDS